MLVAIALLRPPSPAVDSVDWGLTVMVIVAAVLAVALAILVVFLARYRNRQETLVAQAHAAQQGLAAIQERFRGVLDAEAERRRILDGVEAERAQAQAAFERGRAGWEQAIRGLHDQHQAVQNQLQSGESELGRVRTAIGRVRVELNALDEEANLQTFAFYKQRYSFSSLARYQSKLDEIRERQKQMLKDKRAAVGQIEWTVNGSVAEGRKQINQTLKLMLRAFNGECDAAIVKVKYNNVHVMEERLQKARDAINALAAVQQCVIVSEYLALKLDELRLVHEYQEKQQDEREEQRRLREQMREEEAALREIEKARHDAEREEKRYADALAKAREEAERAVGGKQDKLRAQIDELEARLAEAQQNTRAVAQAQLTRAGHVYVISNVGAFGEHVYKIGMTRRLIPMDRVDELGSASVPFDFDVHAMIRAPDAPALETALHRTFHERRVNRVNPRKEFFRVTIDEIATVVTKLHGEIDIISVPEAEEYRKTVAMASAGQTLPALASVSAETPSPAGVTS